MRTKLATEACNFLENEHWFRSLTPDLRVHVLNTSRQKSFRPCSIVAETGEPSLYWYGLMSGFMHMYVSAPDGSETTLYCVTEGEWAGEGSLLKKEIRKYDLRAMTPVSVLLVPAATFEELRNASIPFNHFISELMNKRMGLFVRMLAASRLSGAEMQFASALLMLTKHESQLLPQVEIPQHEIALVAGLSRQSINSAIASFTRKNILRRDTQSSALIVDAKRLHEYLAKHAA